VVAAVDVPVIAIAGITVERVPAVLDTGAWGVAVIGAVAAAADPTAATAALVATIAAHPSGAQPSGFLGRPGAHSAHIRPKNEGEEGIGGGSR
jgi:thiamine-phosphate pyrophosphorylase